jgi:hypothetical protein
MQVQTRHFPIACLTDSRSLLFWNAYRGWMNLFSVIFSTSFTHLLTERQNVLRLGRQSSSPTSLSWHHSVKTLHEIIFYSTMGAICTSTRFHGHFRRIRPLADSKVGMSQSLPAASHFSPSSHPSGQSCNCKTFNEISTTISRDSQSLLHRESSQSHKLHHHSPAQCRTAVNYRSRVAQHSQELHYCHFLCIITLDHSKNHIRYQPHNLDNYTESLGQLPLFFDSLVPEELTDGIELEPVQIT